METRLADGLCPPCRSRAGWPLAFDHERRFGVAKQEERCGSGDETPVSAPNDLARPTIEALARGFSERGRPPDHWAKVAGSREVVDHFVARRWRALAECYLLFGIDDRHKSNFARIGYIEFVT